MKKLDQNAFDIIHQMRSEQKKYKDIAKYLLKNGYATRNGNLLERNIYQFYLRKIKELPKKQNICENPETAKSIKSIDVANYIWSILPDSKKESLIAHLIKDNLLDTKTSDK